MKTILSVPVTTTVLLSIAAIAQAPAVTHRESAQPLSQPVLWTDIRAEDKMDQIAPIAG